jgi:hypothetical protein
MKWELILGAVVYWAFAVAPGWAADNGLPLIGRVSMVSGPVRFHAATGDWSDALANEPVAAGTALRTPPDGEAELRSPGFRVALAASTELRVLRFDDHALQIAVPAGRIGIHLDAVDAAKTVEIDLPQGGVWLAAPGDYDIAVGDARAPAAVQVFAGGVRLGGGLNDSFVAAPERDGFTSWWLAQNDDAGSASERQLPDIAGTAALAAAGSWETDPILGQVWFPREIAADWAPYRNGVWRFLPPWGWTWIDEASWGFAPSHYGSWARIDGRWGWVPGPLLGPADYSPAVVAFLGTAGIGLSRPGGAGPAVAWFPLAPGEGIGDGHEANYQNRRFATAVPRAVFAGGLSVAGSLIDDVPEQRFADAPVVLGSLAIPPGATAPARTMPQKPSLGATAAPAPPAPPVPETTRQPFVVVLHDAPAFPASALPAPARLAPAALARAREMPKRLRVAAALVAHPRPLASAARWLHTRRHFAATRGGA